MLSGVVALFHISKKKTLQSVSPQSPCALDIPGTYSINSSSGSVRSDSFRPEVKGAYLDALEAVILRPDALDAP